MNSIEDLLDLLNYQRERLIATTDKPIAGIVCELDTDSYTMLKNFVEGLVDESFEASTLSYLGIIYVERKHFVGLTGAMKACKTQEEIYAFIENGKW